MSKNPHYKSNNDNDEDNNDGANDKILRRGCCVKRHTRHVTRIHLGGGAWNWIFRAERRYLDPKKQHPTTSIVAHHLVHLNRHLEVYIIKRTHRAEKKNTVHISTNSNISFYGTYGCSNLSLSPHRWVLGKWMSKNPNVKSQIE